MMKNMQIVNLHVLLQSQHRPVTKVFISKTVKEHKIPTGVRGFNPLPAARLHSLLESVRKQCTQRDTIHFFWR